MTAKSGWGAAFLRERFFTAFRMTEEEWIPAFAGPRRCGRGEMTEGRDSSLRSE
mgnify:CR=1